MCSNWVKRAFFCLLVYCFIVSFVQKNFLIWMFSILRHWPVITNSWAVLNSGLLYYSFRIEQCNTYAWCCCVGPSGCLTRSSSTATRPHHKDLLAKTLAGIRSRWLGDHVASSQQKQQVHGHKRGSPRHHLPCLQQRDAKLGKIYILKLNLSTRTRVSVEKPFDSSTIRSQHLNLWNNIT